MLHQIPQPIREFRVNRAFGAIPPHYGQCHRNRKMQVERSCAGEGLEGYTEAISQGSVTDGSSQTYLDHDHRERENIRLFARFTPPLQDLGCSPPCSPA